MDDKELRSRSDERVFEFISLTAGEQQPLEQQQGYMIDNLGSAASFAGRPGGKDARIAPLVAALQARVQTADKHSTCTLLQSQQFNPLLCAWCATPRSRVVASHPRGLILGIATL